MSTKQKQTTTTTLVAEALQRGEDFISAKTLTLLTKRNIHQVFAALHHLRNHKAVDSVESGGILYWFWADHDDRSRAVEERTPETKPRKSRAKRKLGLNPPLPPLNLLNNEEGV